MAEREQAGIIGLTGTRGETTKRPPGGAATGGWFPISLTGFRAVNSMVALGVQSRFKRGPDKPLEGEPIPNPPTGETPEETIDTGDAPREITWTCHPARERPVVAVSVGLFLIGGCWMTWVKRRR